MDILELKQRYDQGKFSQIIRQIEKSSNNQDLEKKILKAYAFHKLGEEEKALKIIEQTENCSGVFYYRIINLKCIILWERREIEEANIMAQNLHKLLKKEESQFPVNNEEFLEEKGYNLRLIGMISFAKGNYEKALPFLNDALQIYRVHNNLTSVATILNDIGNLYTQQNNLIQALKTLKESMILFEKVGNPDSIGKVAVNMGIIFMRNCDFDKAIEYFDKSYVNRKETNNPVGIGSALEAKGLAYSQKGELKTAIKFLIDGLNHMKRTKNTNHTSYILFYLIEIALVNNQIELATIYYAELETMTSKYHHSYLTFRLQVATALMVKIKGRELQKSKLLLEKIIEDQTDDTSYISYLHLLDLLLHECNKEVEIDEYQKKLALFQDRLKDLIECSEDERIYPLLIQVLLLNAKTEIIAQNFAETRISIQKAFNTAKKYNLNLLIPLIEETKIKFETCLLNNKNHPKDFSIKSMKNLMEISGLENFLKIMITRAPRY